MLLLDRPDENLTLRVDPVSNTNFHILLSPFLRIASSIALIYPQNLLADDSRFRFKAVKIIDIKMADEIKERFVGKWKLDRNENFEEFMAAMGLNFFIRKMAGLARPENEIRVEDDGTVIINTNSTFMKNEQRFKIGEEFEEVNNFAKKKFKNMPTFENGKLRIVPTPAEPVDVPYPEYAEREITENGEMMLTIKVGDVICKRFFKKEVS